MQTVQTQLGETVLEGFYPDQLNSQRSELIYNRFVGHELPKNKLFVMFGTDSGLMVDYIAQISTVGQRFIFIDFPEVIEHIKATRPVQLTDKVILQTTDEFEFENLYDNYQDYAIRNAIVLMRSLVVQEDRGRYQGLFKAQQELFHRFLIDRVDNLDFKKMFDQQLDNVCDLVHPLSVIKDRLSGDIPGIVLGGGPSLDQMIPWLKEHQEKIWIFAASRISKRLLKEGITPDFIGVFDGQPLIFEYSKEMYAFEDRSILITGEHSYSRLIRQWSGLKMYSRRRFPWGRRAEENFISDGPTVTNALFGIAAYLGVSNFYLAGVDFCFTREGVCHESSSIESRNKQRDNTDTTALNYKGEQVGTNIQLYDARNMFEEQFLRLKETWSNLEAHNLNEAAAVMEGIDYQSIDQVRFGGKKFKVVETFKDVLANDAESERAFQAFLKAEIASHSKWFSTISRESKKGVYLTSALFKDPAKQGLRTKEILKLKARLEKLLGVDYQTMVNYAYNAFMMTLQPVNSEDNMSQQEMSNALMGFFNGLKVAAEEFLVKLEEIKEELKFRALEVDPTTDFELLANHWLKARIPGRFKLWLTHYAPQPYTYYKTHFAESVTALEAGFAHVLTDESALEAHFNERFNTPDEFAALLKEAFNAQDLTALEQIQRQIKRIDSNQHEYIAVVAYSNGLRLELKGELEDALLHYLTVDPNQKIAIIQQQVSSLAFLLKQYEKGLAALYALSQMDVRVLPSYAAALSLLGRTAEAIAVLKDYPYLDQDTEAFISLLRLHVSVGDINAANTLLEHAETCETLDQESLHSFVDSLNAS